MADLTELKASQSVKIAGANPSTGDEDNFMEVNSDGSTNVKYTDSPQLDGFGRLRVADTDLIESLHFANSGHALLVNNITTGSSTAVYNPSTSSLRLSNTTSNSDSVIAQTKRYFRYNPGRSYIITISGNIGAKKTNVTQRWGYFDINNGIFFEQNSSNLSIVVRTNSSGSPVNTIINQSSWNLDKFDGSGPSGIILNPSMHNLYVIDFLWHGAGRVRFGIMYNGSIVYCHQVDGANNSPTPYMRTPSLPLRAELINTGTTGSSTTLDLVCFAYQKESSDSLSAPYTFSSAVGRTSKNIASTIIPIISIRPKATFNGNINRVPVIPISVQVVTNNQILYVAIYLNPTLTGASFSSVDTNSATEADISATAISGGTLIREFYVAASSSLSTTISSDTTANLELIVLGLDISGSNQDVITIAAQSTAGGTTTFGQIQWQEYQ